MMPAGLMTGTVIWEFAVKFPSKVLALILAEPLFTAVTNPVALTVAIVGSEEDHVTALLVALVGKTRGESCKDLEFSKVAVDGLREIPVTGMVVELAFVKKVQEAEKILLPPSFEDLTRQK
jgi:hypothetical protein